MIASSLTYRGESRDVEKGLLRAPWRLSRIRDHSINILMRQIENLLLENVEHKPGIVMLRPPLAGVSTFNFGMSNTRKAETIAAAQAYASAALADFRRARV